MSNPKPEYVKVTYTTSIIVQVASYPAPITLEQVVAIEASNGLPIDEEWKVSAEFCDEEGGINGNESLVNLDKGT